MSSFVRRTRDRSIVEVGGALGNWCRSIGTGVISIILILCFIPLKLGTTFEEYELFVVAFCSSYVASPETPFGNFHGKGHDYYPDPW